MPPPECEKDQLLCQHMVCGQDPAGMTECHDEMFCAPMQAGCPAQCAPRGEVECHIPPPPDCDPEKDWCAGYNYCEDQMMGCPPPPVFCMPEVEINCWSDPSE